MKETEMCVPGCQEIVRRAFTRRSFFAGAAAAGFAATAATPAQAEVRRFRSVVDLTHTLSPAFPTYFGLPGIELEKMFDVKKDGFNLNRWRLIEHSGTHIDAPNHFSDAGATADLISPASLVVPLVVVNVTARAARNPDYQLSRQDLIQFERRYEQIPENACVAMDSGWTQHIGDPAKYTGKDGAGGFHFPGFAPEAAEWLLRERKVAGIAVDTLSLDHGPSKDFKTHTTWLPAGRGGLENVANLDKVPPTGATLVVAAPKVQGATGGPVRLFALLAGGERESVSDSDRGRERGRGRRERERERNRERPRNPVDYD
jgi:kynurenine formamidase